MKNLFLFALILSCLTCKTNAQETKTVEAKPSAELDFGDGSSSTLTGKAWDALAAKNFDHTIVFAKKCIKFFEKDAVQMQASLTEPVDASDQDAVHEKWALNDVGTCYFILGQALEKQDKTDDAMAAYKTLVKKVSFAQCWDPQGWFWKPVDAAKKRIKVLEFDKLEKDDK